MSNKNNIKSGSVCSEFLADCSFLTSFYAKGSERYSNELKQQILIFCKEGHIRVSSNLFKEEFLCAGEILFVPRGSDYHGIALSDSTLLVHYFNNMGCRVENPPKTRAATPSTPPAT